MSIPVSLKELRAAIDERGPGAYLLTVFEDGRPHAVHTCVAWDGDMLTVEVGKRSTANAVARNSISLLCPLRTPEDYSLIIDATAKLAAGDPPRLLIQPTKAVLHRPAVVQGPTSSCGADCVPLLR